MRIPDYIQEYIEEKLKTVKLSNLLNTQRDITKNYKAEKVKQLNEEEFILVYLLTRFGNIFQVINDIFTKLEDKFDFDNIKTILDVGSGPGTVLFPLIEKLYNLEDITIIEKNRLFIKKFQELSKRSNNNILQKAKVKTEDVTNYSFNLPKQDLVTASYMFNELSSENILNISNKLWNITDKLLVIIEPGSVKGFSNIKMIRDELIKKGAYVLSPCSHSNLCPMKDNDWCHFYKRIERTKIQRYLKEGTESFEDEKFSYIVLSKIPTVSHHKEVILRHPEYSKIGVKFNICSSEGIQEKTYLKREDDFKSLKKLDWGDFIV